MRDVKVKNAEGVEMTIQIESDDDIPNGWSKVQGSSAPAKKKAVTAPANKARAAANKKA